MLPNSPNVIMAAERAAELSDKHGARRAARARSRPGLAAAVALDADARRRRRTPRRWSDALARVRTGAVAPAARDDAQGRFRGGDAVGFVGEELVAWGEPAATLRDGARARSRPRPS